MNKFLFLSAFTLLLFYSSTLESFAQYPLSCCTYPGGQSCGAYCGLDPSDGTGNDYECYSGKTAECEGSWMCYVAPGADQGTCYHPDICPAPGTNTCIIPTPTPLPTPTLPAQLKNWPCTIRTTRPEFHPLRPYPASPCDPYIPRKIPEASPATDNLYLSYSCGKSANPSSTITVDSVIRTSYNEGVNNFLPDPPLDMHYQYVDQEGLLPPHRTPPMICADWTPGNVQACIFAKIVYNVSLDYSEAIFPIFGATQNSANLNDKNKVNNYLSWYLNGTVLQAEQKELDPDNPADIDRLINFSGPTLRLLSQDTLNTLRGVLIAEAKRNRRFRFPAPNSNIRFDMPNVHNDIVNPSPLVRLKDTSALVPPYLANVPLASTEDIVSEMQPALILAGQPTIPEIDGRITRISLYLGAADSRLYFPHLRNSNALSDLVAGTFRPLNPDTSTNDMNIGKNTDPQNRNFVSQWIDKWQGIHDNTKTFFPKMDFITKKSTRNTEVIPYQPAPTPLFTNYAQRFVGVSDQRCDITATRNKPGDSLIGTTIPVTLTIYQLFRYTPDRIIFFPGNPPGSICDHFGLTLTSSPSCKEEPCTGPLSVCTNSSPFTEGSCCWGQCPYYNPCQRLSMDPEYYCDAAPSSGGNPCSGDYEEIVAWPRGEGDCYSNGVLTYTDGNFVCCGPNPEPTYHCEENPYPDTPRGTCAIIGGYPCDSHDTEVTCSSYGDCCSWEVDQVGLPPHPPTPRCPFPWPRQELKNSGRIAIFVKTPMTERIYDTLVSGQQSLLRRFLPRKPDDVPDDKYIKVGKYALPGAGSAAYSAVSDPAGTDVNNVQVTAGSGGSPSLYFPKVGSLYDYILGGGRDRLNLQCLLRPQGQCNAISASASATFSCSSPTPEMIATAIAKASDTYGVPEALLKAVFEIEAFGFAVGAEDFKCERDSFNSMGLMQVTDSAYNLVTCESERYPDDLGICPADDGKLSRCDPETDFELAARVLIWKLSLSMWNFASCQPSPGYNSDLWTKANIYRAANNYYGSCQPTALTTVYSYNLLGPKRTSGDNYGDIVLNKMGYIDSQSDYITPQCP